jgi:hypothetical protein
MSISKSPADAQAHRDADVRPEGEAPKLQLKRDVLMPDLRSRAQDEGRDPEEVDPLYIDEDALRLDSLGGRSKLD